MRIACKLVLALTVCSLGRTLSEEEKDAEITDLNPSGYGVDVSFAMQHSKLRDGPLGDKQAEYETYMDGCRERYESYDCERSEYERLEMNLKQPPAMENYTSAGYAKVEAPKKLFKQLKAYWEENEAIRKTERWDRGNTFVNHWYSSTDMLRLRSSGTTGPTKSTVLSYVQPILEAWTGQSLVPTSVYGIRVYNNGAILAPHVDRLPLVTSAIINIAQDVDTPWPLELIGHDGKAVNVTMEPGEMLLYESHSVLHGRPFPLEGAFYANIFVHFEPHGHTERYNQKRGRRRRDIFSDNDNTKQLFERAKGSQQRPQNLQSNLPEYIEPDSDEEVWWRQQYIFHQERKLGKNAKKKNKLSKTPESMTAHTAAALGRLEILKLMESRDPKVLTKADENGWRPIHEAARSGHKEVIEYLVKKHGAAVNERTNNGRGGTPLWWAEQMLDEDHEVIQLLRDMGAVNIAPEVVE